jgi:Putative peptidoglycan binding domain
MAVIDRVLRDLERELFLGESEVESFAGPSAASGPLRSIRFAADPELQAVALGRLRLGRPNDSPYPTAIRSQGPAVAAIQQALTDLGYPLPRSGIDGRYGDETYGSVLAYKHRYNVRNAGGGIDGIVGPKTMVRLDSEFPSQEVATCSGWESDPQSFAKRAAEFYLRSAWKPGFSVSTIACRTPPPNWNCDVQVTGSNNGPVARINVQLSPADKLVRVQRNSDPKTHMVCFYMYSCTAGGQLVFKESACPTF